MVKVESTFGKRLNEALVIRHVKPIDLSKATGIAQASVSQYRSGYITPKEDKISLIASYLNVNPAWLLGYNAPMELCTNSQMDSCSKIIVKEVIKEEQLTATEREVLIRYRSADRIDRRCVNRVLGIERRSA